MSWSRLRHGRTGLALVVAVLAITATAASAASPPPVLSTGPHGEKAASASSITLTSSELAKVKGMHATAAIALHYGGNDWSTAQVPVSSTSSVYSASTSSP